MGAFASRLGTRFLVVTVVPNILFIGYVSLLLAAGAPTHSPSLKQALHVLNGITGNQVVAIILGLLIISFASHPLQIPLIQLLEGYWWGLPFGPKMANRATERFRKELTKAQNELDKPESSAQDWWAKNAARQARFRQDWLPERKADLLPTELGNTLWTGETTAGDRYELQLTVALPRLIPLMSPIVFAELSDRRNQLDAAVRLCVAAGAATVVGVGLLLWHGGPWLFLALATYVLCWASYRAAVSAARGFSTSLATAVDLYHLQLFDTLSLERPLDITEERKRNKVLTKLFRGMILDDDDKKVLRYIPAKADEAIAESGAKASS